MYLIVGLGNPGREYEQTRHNVGFLAIETLAKLLGITELSNKKKCFSLVGEGMLQGHKVFLAQPQTYMNESGVAVAELLKWYNIAPEKLFVIYDDMDLPVGEVRIREKGSSAGHHGIESIFRHISNHNFVRVRIGIGRSEVVNGADYVLAKIPSSERETINAALELVSEKIKERLSAQ
jgi:PTH1 family peptidyl-tRNA hydrolase